ncbi:MAG TPA: OmpA family protein [Myxococcaceae bacterium]|nr:OmpA family protein [Myxococcaceae bacterium]
MRISVLLALAVLMAAAGCVSGSKIRADADVIRADLDRARRIGAYRCAPRELATAEANLDFALGELSQGSSFRAAEHVRTADKAAKRAVTLSRECGPREVLVRDKPPDKTVVVQVEETDRDGDGIKDNDDQCVDEAEDKDDFKDSDGCPEPDNDGDGLLDRDDKCPNTAGIQATRGCPREDSDGDGVPDDLDRCRDQTEDKDGFQDEDGCPELDNDSDGLLDAADKCPLAPGPPQNLGCPVVDKDADGVNDDKDKCPDEPEDKDGFRDDDGCPDLDNDNDGVPDTQDRCPAQAGGADNSGCPDGDQDKDGIIDRNDKCPGQAGPAENAGCPDVDQDRDGIVDRLDKCPAQAGTPESAGCPDPDKDADGIVDRNDKCPDEPGIAAEQGCPRKYKMVVVKKDRIEIKQQIKFRTGTHRIIGEDSFAILDDVGQALKDNTQIKKIRIEGHTDSTGGDAANLRLSQRRANEVMSQLIRRGIDPGRMEAVGFGETRPIASNSTARGRAENRRTEFNIVEQ